MKIIHNIALSVSKDIKKEFAKHGIWLEEGFTSCKIEESNPKWPAIEKLSKLYEAIDTVSTSFSINELEGAAYLSVVPNWHYGYPEPSENNEYLDEVYNLDNYCEECGTGLIQKSPFKFLKEPKWGNRSILQLNWVFDEFFVKPEIWDKVFKPCGIGCREVLHVKSGERLKSVVQLVIPEGSISLAMDDNYPYKQCEKCLSKKFLPISRGFFPALSEDVSLPMFKTKEVFGSGKQSYKEVIISQTLYSLIAGNKLKGVIFYPLKSRQE